MQLVLKGTYVLTLPPESLIISSRTSLKSFFSSNLWMHSGPHLLVCLHFDFFLFLSQLPFGFASATDFWSGFPPTFLAYLPPSPGSYVLSCRINISDPQPHSSAAKVCIWVFFSHPLWHSRCSTRREALYARVQSHGAISSEGIYKGATMHKGARPASLATSLSLPFIAH